MRIGFLNTSRKELIDLSKAWLMLSIAFAVLMTGFSFTAKFLTAIAIASFTVGLGFLLHELSHKFLAQKYGCFAEFRSFDLMLILALVMSFFGFILAAPGGVMIKGHIGRSRNGIISAAGIVANIILSFLFLLLLILTPLKTIAYYGFYINAWLAVFNLIPIGNFDGIKVLLWDKKAYLLLVVLAGILMLIQPYFQIL
jgi:Zn-dependent protease